MSKIIGQIRRRLQYYLYFFSKFFSKDKMISKVDKIIKIKDSDLKLKELELLYNKNIRHPYLLYHFARFKVFHSSFKGFEILKNYEEIRIKWLKKNKSVNYNINEIFIPTQSVIGALGNTYGLYYYLINRIHVLKNKFKPTLLIKETEKLTNSELIKYFLPLLNLRNNNKEYYNKQYISKINKAPIELVLQYKNTYYPPGIAINFINQFVKNKKILEETTFKINSDTKDLCYKKLEKFGLNEKNWFVVLHVRENKNDPDILRNSDPFTYIDAIKFIISKGGKVVRVGNKRMTKLPPIQGLIDYPFTDLKSEQMDVFLAAECKFCLGTSSGYYSLPTFFGKPVLLVNYLNTLEFFALKEGDLFLPKNLIYKDSNKLVDIKDTFGLEIGNYMTLKAYEKNNILVINNTSSEILESTKEMIDILFNIQNKKLEVSNKIFKEEIDKKYENLFDHKVSTLAKVSNIFLKNFYK
jgi:putative glycosyltransferase (TIGR04372 family)